MRRKQLAKHLDKRELLAHNLVIKYHHERPPDESVKSKLRESVNMAGTMMLKTVWAIDKVVLFHMDESAVMTQVLDKHFCFANEPSLVSAMSGKKLTNAKHRRTWLAHVRKTMLSASFHLNTGVYLLDTDAGHRTIVGDNELESMDATWSDRIVKDSSGANVVDYSDPDKPKWAKAAVLSPAGKKTLSDNIEGYAQTGSSGPVHVSFALAASYSPEMMSRLIIHEATHTFCGTSDVKYAHDPLYFNQTPQNMVNNADSYGYAAVSLAGKQYVDHASLKSYKFK